MNVPLEMYFKHRRGDFWEGFVLGAIVGIAAVAVGAWVVVKYFVK